MLAALIFWGSTQLSAQENIANSPWHIVADPIDPNEYYGITVANGMIGLVSSPDILRVKDVVLNGAFDLYGRGRVSNILKGFTFANLYLDVNGRRIENRHASQMKQVLDMQKATLTTSFQVDDLVKVQYRVLALRHLPYTAMVTLEIEALQDVSVNVGNLMEAPDILRDVRNFYSMIDRPHVKIPLMTSVAKSPTGKHTVAASNSYLFEGDPHHIPELIHEDWDYNMHLVKFSQKIEKGKTFRVGIVGTVCSTAHFDDPHNEAERLTVYAMLEGATRLQQKHEAAWAELWKSDIVVEGDLQAQRDIRSALYHLYSFARAGTAYSLSPMGLSGLGYNGHVFWDTEMWMYPPLLVLQPDIAKSLLEYRFQRLEAAKRNAFSHGYKGAMFPWESADEGLEATPVWALSGPYEHHISGCVAWAFWKYYQVTKDKNWLRERGYPVMKEIADFWVSRVEKGADGKYHINNVVGADEWAENIDDNAFTNAVAIAALEYATQAARELGLVANSSWMEVARNIPILKFPDGTTREHATYEGEDIKQADVNLLAYPLKTITDAATIRKDLAYYEPRIGDGPAMSHAVLSVLYSRLGEPDNAWRLFQRGYKPNEKKPFGVLAENAGGTNPYFATGAGGMLQAVINGFGGLDITDQGIVQLKTKLPGAWKSLTLKGVGVEKKTFQVK
jgi:trehalose/maltose hydrolase-like predicted phosphorylase